MVLEPVHKWRHAFLAKIDPSYRFLQSVAIYHDPTNYDITYALTHQVCLVHNTRM